MAAYQPRSRRPHHSPHAVTAEVEDQIIRLRKELSKQGLDAGAETIAAHLTGPTPGSTPAHPDVPAVSTIWRILSRRGFITPQPQKRPRSSWKHFCADRPNQRWRADTTHWHLADGTNVEILNIIDDHSRLNLGADARRVTLAPDVATSFRKAFARWGIPAGVLTDNGGSIPLRHHSKMHHIGLGTHRAGTKVTMLVDDLHIRVIERNTGELIRELTLDPTRDYQPRGLPPGPPERT